MNLMLMLLSWPETPAAWAALIAVAAVVLALAGAIIFLTVKMVKNGKIDQLRDAVVAAVKEAEKTHASGAEKKEIAIAAVKKYCEGIGLKLDDRLLGWIADRIEGYVKDHNELEEIEEEGLRLQAAKKKAAKAAK